MRKTSLVYSISVLTVLASVGSAREDPKPSLSETEKWILQTFTDQNTGRTSCSEFNPESPTSDFGDGFSCNYERYALDLKGCDATLTTLRSHKVQRSHNLEIKEADEDKKETTVLFFNLHDIEPSSLKATEPTGSFGLLEKKTWHHNEPSADVHFETTDNAETMVLVYPYSDHPTKRYKKHVCCDVIGSGIAMKPEYAARFVKALRHAVELCGGKASVF